MEGKKVKFVENLTEPANADGVCGHLEATGEADGHRSIYDRVVKRAIDLVLSFCGLVVLSPIYLILGIAIMALLGTSISNLVFVLIITSWTQYCKLARNNVLVQKNMDYVHYFH